jgi:hypothetical protein
MGIFAPALTSAWTFYAGNGNWSSQLGDAVSVFDGADILSYPGTASSNDTSPSTAMCFHKKVMIRTSPNPEGPWSDEKIAFTAMPPAQGNVYDAHAHPEYDSNGGQTIYVTYSRSTPAPFSSEVRLVAIQLQTSSSQH